MKEYPIKGKLLQFKERVISRVEGYCKRKKARELIAEKMIGLINREMNRAYQNYLEHMRIYIKDIIKREIK